jgi:hypothetical protein
MQKAPILSRRNDVFRRRFAPDSGVNVKAMCGHSGHAASIVETQNQLESSPYFGIDTTMMPGKLWPP